MTTLLLGYNHPCWVPGHGFDHELEYHEDTIGDFGVINGTYTERYLSCCNCNHEEPAGDHDGEDYGDYDFLE